MRDANFVDGFGRKVNYLRVSITDRCNLRCIYCSPVKDFKFLPHEEILTYEEILRIIRVGTSLGIEKVRFTGGEPFIRKGFLNFLEKVVSTFADIDLRITTNGTLLDEGVIHSLKSIGIKAINVSLDTFDERKFIDITKQDLHKKVLSSIYSLIDAGIKTKINVVILKDINVDDVIKFAHFAHTYPVHVRFIEFMDITGKLDVEDSYFLSSDIILSLISQKYELVREDPVEDTKGPARMYKIVGGRGKIGVISPLSNHFCFSCNRLRVTADGRLRTCLFSEKDYRLKPVLRDSRLGDVFLYRIMKKALSKKGVGRDLLNHKRGLKGMYAVGG